LKKGSFKHFSGLIFEGTFNQDRFSKGRIEFINGNYLIGEWGQNMGKWILKNGTLRNED